MKEKSLCSFSAIFNTDILLQFQVIWRRVGLIGVFIRHGKGRVAYK